MCFNYNYLFEVKPYMINQTGFLHVLNAVTILNNKKYTIEK